MSVRVPRLGPLLEPSWGPLGPSWRRLGPSWVSLGPFWGPVGGLLDSLGAILGAFWAVLERREAEKAKTPKSFKHLKSMNFASWGPLGRPLGGLLGRLGGLLGRLGAILGVLDRSLGVLGPSGGTVASPRVPLEALLARLRAPVAPKKSRDNARGSPGEPPGTPGDLRRGAPNPLRTPQE